MYVEIEARGSMKKMADRFIEANKECEKARRDWVRKLGLAGLVFSTADSGHAVPLAVLPGKKLPAGFAYAPSGSFPTIGGAGAVATVAIPDISTRLGWERYQELRALARPIFRHPDIAPFVMRDETVYMTFADNGGGVTMVHAHERAVKPEVKGSLKIVGKAMPDCIQKAASPAAAADVMPRRRTKGA